jgi:hypothetical protein
MRIAVKMERRFCVGISGVDCFYNHPQGTHVAANCCWPLCSILFVSLDQLADGRVIIPQSYAFSGAARICPKRFNDLRGDAFGRCDLFGRASDS